VKADIQDFDGNDIFEIAKHGSLYLKPCSKEQSTTVSPTVTDDKEECELPAGPCSTGAKCCQERIAEILRQSHETVKRLRVCWISL